MKPLKSLWLVLSSLLFLLLVSAHDSTSIQLNPTYHSPKNIVFVCYVPGSSHITWVMRFLDELADRGHNITFLTIEQNAKYSAAYPRIKTVAFDIPLADISKMMAQFDSHPDFLTILPHMFERMIDIWQPGYENTLKFLENNKVDTFICDHRTDACLDVAYEKKIPMVLTATIAMFPDASTSYTNNNILTLNDYTTRHLSIFKRFYNTFLLPISIMHRIKPVMNELAKAKQNAGIANGYQTSDQKSKHAIKIVCSLFGVEPARPVGPLIEMVGPLLETTYPGLDTAFDTFLSTHQRVVYVAFGQHAVPDAFDVTQVLTPLIQQYEKGHIDGIIWSSKYAGMDRFPTSITSPYSGQQYDLSGCFDNDKKGGILKDLFVTRWSPQMAVLMHPSVSVFITHGGANSLFESLYAGKRLIFYPFFGDQPGTAKQLSRYGASEYFDHKTDPAAVSDLVEKVVLDEQGTYQHHIRRYQAMIQIQAKSSPIRAADLVEETAFANLGGDEPHRLPHREDVGHDVHWAKRHNYDIYAMAFFAAGSILSVIGLIVYKIGSIFYRFCSRLRKTKTL